MIPRSRKGARGEESQKEKSGSDEPSSLRLCDFAGHFLLSKRQITEILSLRLISPSVTGKDADTKRGGQPICLSRPNMFLLSIHIQVDADSKVVPIQLREFVF